MTTGGLWFRWRTRTALAAEDKSAPASTRARTGDHRTMSWSTLGRVISAAGLATSDAAWPRISRMDRRWLHPRCADRVRPARPHLTGGSAPASYPDRGSHGLGKTAGPPGRPRTTRTSAGDFCSSSTTRVPRALVAARGPGGRRTRSSSTCAGWTAFRASTRTGPGPRGWSAPVRGDGPSRRTTTTPAAPRLRRGPTSCSPRPQRQVVEGWLHQTAVRTPPLETTHVAGRLDDSASTRSASPARGAGPPLARDRPGHCSGDLRDTTRDLDNEFVRGAGTWLRRQRRSSPAAACLLVTPGPLDVARHGRTADGRPSTLTDGSSVFGQAEAASSSTATSLVRFGSTWTPGPMVVDSVTFLM